MKLLYAAVATLMLSLTACNSDNNDVVCDANGCRNTNQTSTVNTVNSVNGCFVNSAGTCQSSIAGVACTVNTANQCVPLNNTNTVNNCIAFDAFGNCIQTTNTINTINTACTFRDRFGNCLPSICRFIDQFGRCIF